MITRVKKGDIVTLTDALGNYVMFDEGHDGGFGLEAFLMYGDPLKGEYADFEELDGEYSFSDNYGEDYPYVYVELIGEKKVYLVLSYKMASYYNYKWMLTLAKGKIKVMGEL